MTQLFDHGDLVHIAEDLGPMMSHFTSGCEAIVLGSYADQFGGDKRNDYQLYLRGHGSAAWYYGQQLTLLERGRADLLEEWRAEVAAEAAMRGDPDWIFEQRRRGD